MIRLDLPQPDRRPKRAARSTFSAAQFTRLVRDWYAALASPDGELRADLQTLRARSRQLCRDTPHGAGYVRNLKDNIIGPVGLRYRPEVKTRAGDYNRPVNDQLKREWKAWGRLGVPTVDGRMSWLDLEHLMIGTVATDGEFLAIHRRGYPNRWGYALQIIDADQLDETMNRQASGVQNEVRLGVEIDRDGRPIAYHFWSGHPADSGMKSRQRVRVLAQDVVHVFEQMRPGQTRGIPWLTPVMLRMKLLDRFDQAHAVAAGVAAAKPFWFTQDAEVYDPEAEKVDAEAIEMEVQPGMGGLLPPGVGVEFFDAKFPSTNYGEYQKASLRAISSGAGMAYNTFANDLEGISYSSLRGGVLAERDLFRRKHVWAEEHFHCPIYGVWLEQASLTRAIRLPSEDLAEWSDARFFGRGWDWVDPLKDIAAFKEELALGLNTLSNAARERGRDFEENLAERAMELEMIEEWEVPVGYLQTQGVVAVDAVSEPAEMNTAPSGTPPAVEDDTEAEDVAEQAARLRLAR